MSEPRKLYTGSASGGLDQEQYEAARRRAQQLAEQNARRRTVQQPMRTAQGRHISQRPVVTGQSAPAPEPPVQEPARQAAPAPERPRELTYAQRQAMAYRAAAERKYGDTLQFQVQRPRRTVNRPPEPEQRARQAAAQLYEQPAAPRRGQQPAPRPQAQAPVQQAAPVGGIRLEEAAAQPRRAKHADAPQPAAHKPRTAAGGNGGSRKPPRDDDDAPRKAKGRKSGKKGGSGKGGNGKKKKKIRWWQILLITLLVIALIFGGAFALIMGAIAPESGSIKLNQLINTPKEFQGKELNFLMIGIDRSTQKEGDDLNDAGVDDGNTDMILYVHFNNETGEMKMLQIPRDTMVTTDRSVSGNYRINNIAKTQAADSDSMNMAALCEQISNMYQLPLDGYMTIRLEMLVQLVDTFGGIELYVPQEMDYKGSHLDQGYQTLNGDACEFLLRTRHIYPDGDIGRLNMQRQFYSALFRRLKSIGNIWDVAKLTPAVLNYMETSLSASQLVSFAVSMLKIDSSKIMICQMPIKMAGKYNGQAVVYPARQEDADILNQYFRENTGFVDASELQLCDDASVLGFDLSGYTATDANVQYMGQLNQEAADAQQNQNLDGSHTVEYVDSESTDTADSSSDSTEAESQPAA
ncbi:LCP family protein [uncultured Gemmiger sp.]|uniref:LCP family protein n=1 Tax=uncultured Gemmiger sp. TaxID=1623490 RepID=UPI002592A49E|nr:LCP family protein [uncultured Gemmiger sp.]